ncbi:MAG: AbrB/MazE/SpoVT family DNA-binding domain-containing protein [Alphaproteobacteria bacterium]|nr:AbrB/MazE/SpoVT family DNA-binding domain-containing protein [Rhizobiaceae bacterium]MBU3961633.1 AbrB/MazE/SpoVT family DNA-binding domain-containing protein [Alphaproteobacteria bacterium]MBU4050203.1 AbrB/MazE/SpoVT family DNA-binding domain-containing protein [Alphaproteobacteria bacterium]MBU4088360.1 AbrB/MazE/SpoVT family DNA-binding domain-containing protein [Alphaproteobacteria bacterium]MBU4158135.1 AbrB/MazE/SpoVT family DNA-binding domain-containing protein [Alphaproteobacteria b
MNVIIRKIGNSEGIIIPKEILDRLGLKAGDKLDVEETDGGIRLTPEPADLTEQMEAAREGMKKYRIALRELAK